MVLIIVLLMKESFKLWHIHCLEPIKGFELLGLLGVHAHVFVLPAIERLRVDVLVRTDVGHFQA